MVGIVFTGKSSCLRFCHFTGERSARLITKVIPGVTLWGHPAPRAGVRQGFEEPARDKDKAVRHLKPVEIAQAGSSHANRLALQRVIRAVASGAEFGDRGGSACFPERREPGKNRKAVE